MPHEAPVVVEHPTGAEDPFDPVEPGDPYHLKPTADPLAPSDPDPEPTKRGGVEIPRPPAVSSGTQPPAGHAELTIAISSLPSLPDPTDRTPNSRTKTWRTAQEGRYSLSEHWAMIRRLCIATAEVGADRADDPKVERAKLKQLRTDLAADGAVSAALEAWCAARDATPVDLAALARAAAELKVAVGTIGPLLGDPDDINPSGVDLQRMMLGQVLAGIVVEVASEGHQALAGGRVARGTASDMATYHVAKMTRDRNWASRLESSSSWFDAGRMIFTAIGEGKLNVPVSKASGKLNLEPMRDRLLALDKATTAREKGEERSGGPADYQTRSDVLSAYVGAADALRARLQTVRNRQAELAGTVKGTPGWDAATARTVGDVLAGTARALQAELAADPLMQDPDLAQAARKAVVQLGELAGQTSLEALVDKAGTDLRKVWRDAKTRELKALKEADVDLGDLSKQFAAGDKGLGPLLDQWSVEIAKFPKHSRSNVKNLAAQIAEQLQRYRTAIDGQLGAKRSSGLVEGLDIVATALTRQIRSFDSRGGLFG